MGKALTIPQIAAVAAGNALEFYDFLTFGFFAVQIGAVFFPGDDPTTSLLKSLAIFGVGFTTRPLGGALIGPLGDRIGRKPAMLFCFALMAISIIGMALTPSYASIGLAAPFLAVAFRMLQGFALGGEVGPATAFLMEAAPAEKRGLYVSLQHGTQQVATLLAGIVGLVLANLLSPAELTSFGWRIAMLVGVVLVPLALVIRQRLPETLTEALKETQGAKPPRLSRGQLWLGLLGVVMLAANTIATYTLNYMGTFAIHSLGLPAKVAFAATVAGGLCATLGALSGGFLSDRIGRKPAMISGTCALLAVGLPCFLVLTHWPGLMTLVLMSGLMALCLGFFGPAILVSLSESMPASLRAGSLGITYAVAISSFGGTAQIVVTWLIQMTGSPLAPAFYMSGALILGLGAMFAMKETAPIKAG